MLTRESQVSNDSKPPLLCVAHKRQVNVQHEEGHTCQESNHPDTDCIMTRRVVVIENAFDLSFVGGVDVALSRDTGKHHHGKNLQKKRKEGGH